MPFLPFGYGGEGVTEACLKAVAQAGASVIELGIPFSDPVADGPTIQAAYHEALEGGATTQGALDAVKAVRGEVDCPILTMVSYSLVKRWGDQRFCEAAKAAGVDGVLCPDLPAGEAEAFVDTCGAAGLESVLLVAPNTSPARRDVIGKLATGFVYYLSVAGITGQRDALPADLAAGVKDMKGRTDRPVCVGFGISRPEHVKQLAGAADGAVVGSAIVRAMQQAKAGGAEAMAKACGEACRQLIGT